MHEESWMAPYASLLAANFPRQGSPFVSADLIRAGVPNATAAIVFKQRLGSEAEVSLVDADVVCIYRYGT